MNPPVNPVIIALIILSVVFVFITVLAIIGSKNMKKNPLFRMIRDPRFVEALGGKENVKRAIKMLGRGANFRGYVLRLADANLIKLDILKDIGFPYVSLTGNDITISLKEEGGTNLIALVASEQTQTLSLDCNENISAPNENVSAQPANNQPVANQQPVNNQPISNAKPLQNEKELDPYEQWMALQNQDKQ